MIINEQVTIEVDVVTSRAGHLVELTRPVYWSVQ